MYSATIYAVRTARRKTMSKDGSRKISAMHVTLNAAITITNTMHAAIGTKFVLLLAETEMFRQFESFAKDNQERVSLISFGIVFILISDITVRIQKP